MTEGLMPAASSWPEGSQVVYLRTRSGAPLGGHALIIGSPLAGLQGVPECLAAMRGWLESRGFVVAATPASSEAASVDAQMKALHDVVEPGDWVLVYYAGHGMQVLPPAGVDPTPLAVLLPIDAFEAEVVITADTWLRWIRALADKARPARGAEGAGVVLIMECCHALALMERWPEGVARTAIMDKIRRWLAQGTFRDPTDPLPGVVRVLATGRDDRADVGELTAALVGRLREHPDEPWWALMDRLRAGWTKPQQHPGVAGPVDRVPLSVERFVRPVGLVPCERRAGHWSTDHAGAMGWTSHRRLALTPSLRLPVQAWAELAADGRRLRMLDPSSESAMGHFAWAWAAPQRRHAVVMVDGPTAEHRHALTRRLEPLAAQVIEATPGCSIAPRGLLRFVATDRAVELHDPWGDRVARTSHCDEQAWSAWIDRLLSLEDWLSIADRGSPWPEGAIRLRWGSWDDQGCRVPWSTERPRVTTATPLWVEIAAEPWVRGYGSLFRIRADRVVEALSGWAPGGLPVVGSNPAVVGRRDDPLYFDPPPAAFSDEPRTEFLVALVCDRPLPLALLARGPVGSPANQPPPRYRGDHDAPVRLTMVVRTYQRDPLRLPGAEHMPSSSQRGVRGARVLLQRKTR